MKILEPISIGTLQLKNRIMVPPHAVVYAGPAGEVTQRQIDYVVERAKAGAAIVSTEDTSVAPGYGMWGTQAQRIDSDDRIPMYRELTDAVRAAGAKSTIQLNVALWGAIRDTLGGKQPVSASEIPWQEPGVVTRALEVEEIEGLVEAFAEGARRAREAGFDAIHILGAEGYGINQFLSPHYNHRTDAYGGTPEKRARFALEIVRAIKAKLGADFPIIWDLNCNEFLEDGLTFAEAQMQAQMLEEAGVDAFRIQRGNFNRYDAIIPPWNFAPGEFVPLAAGIKKVVKHAKVETEGRITDPAMAEEILERGDADIIGLVRAFMADPEWLHKAVAGRTKEIRQCIACVRCIDNCMLEKPVECAVNPRVGHEGEEEYDIRPAARRRKVMVIGGGPGGMEAAKTAALRGHEVSLYEKGPSLGGLMSIGAVISEEFDKYLQYAQDDLRRAGVSIKTKREVTPALLESIKPDVIILASGAEVRPLKVEGIDGPNVLSSALMQPHGDGEAKKKTVNVRSVIWAAGAKIAKSLDAGTVRRALAMDATTGKNIVVLGDELAGYEMAHFFHKAGKKVTLVKVPEALVDGVMLPLLFFLRWDGGNLPLDFASKGIEIVTDVADLVVEAKGVRDQGRRRERAFPRGRHRGHDLRLGAAHRAQGAAERPRGRGACRG